MTMRRNAVRCAAFLWRLSHTRRCSALLSSTNIIGNTAGRPSVRLFSSSFQPAPPPGTHGTPVFPNIDFSVAQSPTSESYIRNTDPNAVFVVTGANRGIGLQFVKSLIERSKGTIVALCRSPDSASALLDLKAANPDRLSIVQLDLEDQSSIESAGEAIRSKFKRVDVLLNVAGILGDAKSTPGPERSLTKLDRRWFERTVAINVVGPAMLSKELMPLIVKDRRKRKDGDTERPTAIVANLSARVGSISDNGLGGWYSYRMSKSALNQFTRTLALELKRHSAWSLALHPGTTDTDLSVPFQANVKEGSLFPVEFTVSQLLNIIDSMTENHSGGFYDWSGQSLSF